MLTPNNEDIARWMGEYSEVLGIEGTNVYNGPMYSYDPAAALRVLARMSDAHAYHLTRGSADMWYVIAYQPKQTYQDAWWHGHTPCAAICAAWEAEFGGGE